MQERMMNIIIIFTLSVVAFTLVTFSFQWLYELWHAEEPSRGWLMPIVIIPSVAVISALLIYLFIYALGLESQEGTSPYR